jgi:hypothetical protein
MLSDVDVLAETSVNELYGGFWGNTFFVQALADKKMILGGLPLAMRRKAL